MGAGNTGAGGYIPYGEAELGKAGKPEGSGMFGRALLGAVLENNDMMEEVASFLDGSGATEPNGKSGSELC